jgi:hypothetical protein
MGVGRAVFVIVFVDDGSHSATGDLRSVVRYSVVMFCEQIH